MIEINSSKKLGTFIRVNKTDAIEIIESLSSQIINNSPNVGRREFNDNKGKYFSIGVIEEANRVPMIHPCKCKEYNGGQCYNCLNGAHDICESPKGCKTKRSNHVGLRIRILKRRK